jgi:dienelactone hydrolase
MNQAQVAILLGLLGMPAMAQAPATTQSAQVSNGWSSAWFNYDSKAPLVIQEAMPTAAQVNFYQRPAQLAENARITPTTQPADPRVVGDVDIRYFRFKDADGQVVPALLCTPHGKKGPFPVVVAVHGLGSNKAQVCGQVAPALTRRGVAVIAPDLPLHGERPGDPHTIFNLKDPFKAFKLYREAVIDVRQCIDLAAERPELDTSNVTLVGYSMGSWINSVAGPCDERVKQMVLMVGGARDVPPAAAIIPQLAAIQPQLAIAHFARPLLMLNGQQDHTVTPTMAKTLYAAAHDPKEQIWYPSGHHLPNDAYEKAASWIDELLHAQTR